MGALQIQGERPRRGRMKAARFGTQRAPQVQAMPFPPEFFGAGGPKLAEAGAQLAVDLTQHAVIGLSDALKKFRQFKKIFDELFQLALGREPDVCRRLLSGEQVGTRISSFGVHA